jgi:hypothetical protein
MMRGLLLVVVILTLVAPSNKVQAYSIIGQREAANMAGRIGSVQRAQDGQTYGFVIYDMADRACVYLGFSTWHDADRAAREAQGLLATALACVKQRG